eukprot:FR740293.1.p2 GENE.FR740293.1~~FR740293.1.p2  ORF type:complete len:103 (+),score=47.78 FR740293.1:561-869(+)
MDRPDSSLRVFPKGKPGGYQNPPKNLKAPSLKLSLAPPPHKLPHPQPPPKTQNTPTQKTGPGGGKTPQLRLLSPQTQAPPRKKTPPAPSEGTTHPLPGPPPP